jgi:regulator of sigma E protease
MAILAFGVLIIVHELGHFTLAKLNGVRVEEFSIGMGPKIFSKQGKETKYSLGLFPIGGYVKMMGEEDSVEDERSFSAKSPLRRISIIAGVL